MKMKEYATIVVVAIVGIFLLKGVFSNIQVPVVSDVVKSV